MRKFKKQIEVDFYGCEECDFECKHASTLEEHVYKNHINIEIRNDWYKFNSEEEFRLFARYQGYDEHNIKKIWKGPDWYHHSDDEYAKMLTKTTIINNKLKEIEEIEKLLK